MPGAVRRERRRRERRHPACSGRVPSAGESQSLRNSARYTGLPPSRVRRSKLYYLRDLKGKAARIKEKV